MTYATNFAKRREPRRIRPGEYRQVSLSNLQQLLKAILIGPFGIETRWCAHDRENRILPVTAVPHAVLPVMAMCEESRSGSVAGSPKGLATVANPSDAFSSPSKVEPVNETVRQAQDFYLERTI